MPRLRATDDESSRNFSITVRCSTMKLYDHFLKEDSRIPTNEYEAFSTSPFSQFLRLEGEERLKIITSIITEIVANRVGRLKYAFEGRVLEFKMTDLALIMGPLNFGRLPVDFVARKPSQYSDFRQKYFPKNLHINDEQILEALTEARRDKKADKDDVHRLNRLYFLAVFLLPDSSKTIDVRYVDLAEKLDDFDKFPWGTACFKLLESTLEDVYTKVGDGVNNYCMNGCLFAFIIWAYQHLPDIGPRRRPNSPFPRMIGWYDLPTRNKSAKKIAEKFHPKKGFINLAYPLDITLEERVAANLQAVEEYQAIVQAEYEESSTSRPVVRASRPSPSTRGVSNVITFQKDALEAILKGVFEMGLQAGKNSDRSSDANEAVKGVFESLSKGASKKKKVGSKVSKKAIPKTKSAKKPVVQSPKPVLAAKKPVVQSPTGRTTRSSTSSQTPPKKPVTPKEKVVEEKKAKPIVADKKVVIEDSTKKVADSKPKPVGRVKLPPKKKAPFRIPSVSEEPEPKIEDFEMMGGVEVPEQTPVRTTRSQSKSLAPSLQFQMRKPRGIKKGQDGEKDKKRKRIEDEGKDKRKKKSKKDRKEEISEESEKKNTEKRAADADEGCTYHLNPDETLDLDHFFVAPILYLGWKDEEQDEVEQRNKGEERKKKIAELLAPSRTQPGRKVKDQAAELTWRRELKARREARKLREARKNLSDNEMNLPSSRKARKRKVWDDGTSSSETEPRDEAIKKLRAAADPLEKAMSNIKGLSVLMDMEAEGNESTKQVDLTGSSKTVDSSATTEVPSTTSEPPPTTTTTGILSSTNESISPINASSSTTSSSSSETTEVSSPPANDDDKGDDDSNDQGDDDQGDDESNDQGDDDGSKDEDKNDEDKKDEEKKDDSGDIHVQDESDDDNNDGAGNLTDVVVTKEDVPEEYRVESPDSTDSSSKKDPMDVVSFGGIEDDSDVNTAYPLSQKEARRVRLAKARQNIGNVEVVVGLKCDGKISSLFKEAFFKRDVVESDTQVCHYFWNLAKDKKWWSEFVRVYGYNDGCSVKPYNTLYKDNWLDGDIIHCYLKLLIRWYSTMSIHYFKEEDQYAIVSSTYLHTKIKHAVKPLFNQLMKDKSFAKLKPQERILSGRFKIDDACSFMVDPWLGLIDQVHPVKAKALLIPLQVNDNHWVLTSFNFREGIVRIYDSLGSKRATQELKDLEQFLGYVLYGADPSQVELNLEMKWKREYVDCVQQDDGCSCGLFLLAFVECVLRGIPPQFDPDPIQMRFRIARDLIDAGESPSSVKKKK